MAKDENLVWAKDVPWEGLGADFSPEDQGKLTIRQMMKKAKVDWKVDAVPLHRKVPMTKGETLVVGSNYQLVEVPAQALVRSDTGAVLDVVGPSYIPVQNEDAFELFQEMLEDGNAKLDTMGFTQGGKYVWAMADLGESFTVAGKEDKVKGYIFIGCPHQQGKSLLFKSTSLRMACNNMIARMVRGKTRSLNANGSDYSEVRRTHRMALDKAALQSAKAALGVSREDFHHFAETSKKLHKVTMSTEDVLSVLSPVYAPNFEGKMTMDQLTPRMRQLMDIYENAPGATPGTAWGVLNAASYYNTHVAGKSKDRRFFQNLFSKGAAQSNQVLLSLT